MDEMPAANIVNFTESKLFKKVPTVLGISSSRDPIYTSSRWLNGKIDTKRFTRPPQPKRKLFFPLVAGNTYWYYVAALNDAGASAPSNTVNVNFWAPTAPTGLTGVAVRIAGSRTQDRVSLTWTDNANNETGFRI